MSLVVAICGMSGAGKSTVREFFQEKGFEYIHLGVTEEVMRVHGFTNEELERKMRVEVRQKYGMGAMAVLVLEHTKDLFNEGKNIVIDNMYSWSEYKIFKDEFGESFSTVAVLASPKYRYERLLKREFRPQDAQTSKSRDYAELEELEKGGPIAMADYNIVNEEDEENLKETVENIIEQILKGHEIHDTIK